MVKKTTLTLKIKEIILRELKFKNIVQDVIKKQLIKKKNKPFGFFSLYKGEKVMKLKKLILGTMQTNCYVLIQDNQECLLVDPGAQGQKVTQYLDENELVLKGILLTHGHFDHIGAVDYLYEKYHCPVYTHEYTCDLLEDSYLNLSENFGQPFVMKTPVSTDVNQLNIAGFHIQWLLLRRTLSRKFYDLCT